MSRYIDADVLIDDLLHNRGFYPAMVSAAIKNTPTADVVEVVRCKDCRWYLTANWDGTILYGCDCTEGLKDVEPNGFCSYGERK